MSERWLVTGARGFLGRHVCAHLRDRGLEVTPLDRSAPAQQNGLVADLAEEVPRLGAGELNVVVHLASLVHHQASGPEFERSIVGGTENLLSSLDRLESGPSAIVYASSVAVYGLVQGDMVPESTPPLSRSPYGFSKYRAEQLVSNWATKRGVKAQILRLPALVGAGAAGSLAMLIDALRRRYYVGIGPGDARRSLVLASDVAAALPRLVEHEGVFHLTDRAHPSFLALEATICARLGRRLPPRMPLVLARGFGRLGDLVQGVGLAAPFSSEILQRTTSTLTFDDSLAVKRFGWTPRPVLQHLEDLGL